MRLSRFVGLVTVGGVLASCGGSTQQNAGISEWYYFCGGSAEQSMTWKFRQGELGSYHLEGGTILTPVDPETSKTLFIRQDGVEFNITGDSAKWLIQRVGAERGTTCERSLSEYKKEGTFSGGGNLSFEAPAEVPNIEE